MRAHSRAGFLLAMCIAMTAHSCFVEAGIPNQAVMYLKMSRTALRTNLRRLCCIMELVSSAHVLLLLAPESLHVLMPQPCLTCPQVLAGPTST